MIQLGLININEWPFGKYKGYAIEDIPTDYLVWVVCDSNIGRMPLKRAMEELNKREKGLLNKKVNEIRKEVLDTALHNEDTDQIDVEDW